MELNRFSRYNIRRVSEMFDLQVEHISLYMTRYRVTREQYYEHCLKLNYLSFGLWQTALQWATLLLVLLMTTRRISLLEGYIETCRRGLQIQEFEIFIYTNAVCFLATEALWAEAFSRLMNYSNGMLEVAWELSDRLDGQLARWKVRKLLQEFTHLTFTFGLLYKASAASLVPLILQLLLQCIHQFVDNQMDLFRLFAYTLLTVSINAYGILCMALNFMILPHFLTVLSIFHLQMATCVRVLATAHAHASPLLLAGFTGNYLALHRHLQMYNGSFCKALATYDSIFKVCGLLAVIYFLKADAQLNMVAYITVYLFGLTYLTFQLVTSKLAYFPEQNLLCYRHLVGLSARAQRKEIEKKTKTKSKTKTKTKTNRIEDGRRQNRVANYECLPVRTLLKTDSLVAFLSANRFAFSHGRQHLITRLAIGEKLLANLGVLILFYKYLTLYK